MLRSILCDASRMLESLCEVTGVHSFVLAVDPSDPSDMGFLGGSVVGREFWRGMRGGGEAGAKTFKAHCLREMESQPTPPFGREEGPSTRASSVSAKPAPARFLKNDLYESVRKALRSVSGVRTAEMKWTNPERLDVYGVRLVGWPASIPAQNPSTLKAGQNKTLLECLENGTMRFEKLFPDPGTADYTENYNLDEGRMPNETEDDDDFSWAYDADAGEPSLNTMQEPNPTQSTEHPNVYPYIHAPSICSHTMPGSSWNPDISNRPHNLSNRIEQAPSRKRLRSDADQRAMPFATKMYVFMSGGRSRDSGPRRHLNARSFPEIHLRTSAPVDPTAPNLHPVSEAFKDNELFGELEPRDTEWLCAGGFITETQTFYIAADDGKFLMCQVIHSAVGLWYPTIQFVFKYFDPQTKETIWKSINVNNFVTPPPGLDKRSSKADEFSITFKHTPGSDHPESYTIRANLGTDLQLSFEIARPASIPGWKVGKGPKGGYTYFGPDPAKAEGYAIHRFWPHFRATGHMIHKGKAASYQGPGMMVHAIQGMRPNLLAASWNFGNFQSEQHGGVSAIQMEFKTCDSHGQKGPGSGGVWVNVGSLVVGGKLVAVTAETKWPDEEPLNDGVVSRTTHLNAVLDPDTSYKQPRQILFEWQAPSILLESPGTVKAKLEVDVGDLENPKGLIEKVDVLAEIPYVVRMAVNYVAGTKPYIYQWCNPTTLSITGPDSVVPGLSKGLEVSGVLFNEASFIS
ncbi:hypothetical protein D9615_004403 [Tricholomella constricta]|uniref:Survival factor 1 n=1 Tax=Tricholomella constricta TaxID=117010 RepID=A0A8H5HF77_9AGAR|nr:hypothetical protein D9615_004403 [Tricholomella constricta]